MLAMKLVFLFVGISLAAEKNFANPVAKNVFAPRSFGRNSGNAVFEAVSTEADDRSRPSARALTNDLTKLVEASGSSLKIAQETLAEMKKVSSSLGDIATRLGSGQSQTESLLNETVQATKQVSAHMIQIASVQNITNLSTDMQKVRNLLNKIYTSLGP